MQSVLVAVRRIVKILLLLIVAVAGAILGLAKMGTDVLPPPYSQKVHVCLDYLTKGAEKVKEYTAGKSESGGGHEGEEVHHEAHKLVVSTPKVMDVTVTERYVCQIHSQRHIEVRALDSGYLQAISVREGQAVQEKDLMFQLLPVLYKAKLDAEVAEAELARLKWAQAKKLMGSHVVSDQDVKLHEAEYMKAEAKKELAKAEMNFTEIRAPFNGIVDRLLQREGSLIQDGDILTTLSDNSVMWVYFNVPEKRYLQYMAEVGTKKDTQDIQLELADHNLFPHTGKIGAIEAKFNNETGNIAFRADFPNPDRLLRHGQTGTILINRPVHDAVVIPQRATFENLAKQYIYVVGEDEVVRQRGITVQHELEDVYVLAEGVIDPKEKIVVEGIRQVRDGDKVEYDFRKPEEILANAKFRAE